MVMLFSHNPDEIRNDNPENICRVIRFGSTHCIGRIEFIDRKKGFFISTSNSGVEAVGDVPVPNDCEVYLTVTESGACDLSSLANIEADDLSFVTFECEPEDFQLKHLMHLSKLNALSFQGIFVSEFGLAFIGQMPGLKLLNLSDSNIEDAGVEKLSQLQLETLYLGGNGRGTRVSDSGLRAISKMHSLQRLELPNSSNDKSLDMLAELKLESLYINRGQLSEEAIPVLKARGITKEVVVC